MNKKEKEISPEAKLIANLIYDQLDCPTKFKLKYVMQGGIDAFEKSECEKVEVQHNYGKTRFPKENQL